MANTLSREQCFTCEKGNAIFKCQGCLQTFCSKHSTEHRQKLYSQLDEIVQEQDKLFQELTSEDDRYNVLTNRIQKWEDDWIEKVKQIARDAQQEINSASRLIKEMLYEKIPSIREQLAKAQEENDFIEIDLAVWTKTLHELKNDVVTHCQDSSAPNDPIKLLKHRMLGMASAVTDDDDDDEDFSSVAEFCIGTRTEFEHSSVEEAQVKIDLEHQSSTQTHDEASTDEQSDPGEQQRFAVPVIRGRRFFRGSFHQRGIRNSRGIVTHDSLPPQAGFDTYLGYDHFDPYGVADPSNYNIPVYRGKQSRSRNQSRGRGRKVTFA